MTNSSDHRLLLPETIWLETEDYQRANIISNHVKAEKQRWQTYLNLIALFGLESWLAERLPQPKITPKIDTTKQIYYLQVGDFTITAIAVSNLLDEMVQVSSQQLNNHPTHFYALLEINEEAEEAIFRGLLRRDNLDAYLVGGNAASRRAMRSESFREASPLGQVAYSTPSASPGNQSWQTSYGDYSFPLSWFDPEPNHLLAYCQHLTPEAIALPVGQTESTPTVRSTITATRTKLTQWLQDTVIEGWSAIETLIDSEMNLAYSTRNVALEYKKGKLINLGVELNNITMALLVTVKEEEENKLGVVIQLYPISGEQYLPPQVQLTLLSKAGKTLQSSQARERDNYIQLKPFKGKLGKRFSIEIALEDMKVKEDFEL
ncbi:conserved hypothetical protein [Hyella patelloides LEGE 07179]|uniref:DUF1822 family protein n=1 Tax=Hyella patelloides LEGE 07179 TaxID=945734 RepID=A0A563VMQ4_9CYAN|nr:DUF1822 family protein [Hyella patelloides]VEP12565.1 conserved hypothetical protein [Hyella patelloides LEGE 07179]